MLARRHLCGSLCAFGFRFRTHLSGLGASFTVFTGLAFTGELLLLHLLDGDDAGIFSHLHGFACYGADRFATGLTNQIALGICESVQRFLERVGGIAIGSHPTGDLNRVARLIELERNLAIKRRRLNFRRIHVHDVLSARQQLILGFELFNGADRAFNHDVLHHHHIARLGNGKVRFRGDDQAEGL